MQARYDLLCCYAALAVIAVISLIIPVPVPIHMLIDTVLIIYIACHQAAQITKESQATDLKQETMRRSDVYMFPIIGSFVLFSLYLFFKIFPRWLMISMFKLYFLMGGVWVVAQRVSAITVGVCTEEQEQQVRTYKLELPLKQINAGLRPVVSKINQARSAMVKALEPVMPYLNQIPKLLQTAELTLIEKIDGKEAAQKAEAAAKEAETTSNTPAAPLPSPTSQGTSCTASTNDEDWFPDLITLDGVNAIAYATAIFVSLMYLLTNHWIFNNIFGICFSIQAIELINLGSYMNGAILLCGLFFYDIFWVFGTDVMVTVAKGVDAPIKLLFPRGEHPAMLGLGDIVIPGLFISLMLRYDIFLARPFNHRDVKSQKLGALNAILNKIGSVSFITISTDYFNLVMIGYILGLITTVGVMFVFKAAQPALLYLVPGCLLFTAGIAAALGQQEFNSLVNYSDNPSEQGANAVPSTPQQAPSQLNAPPSPMVQ